MGDHIVDGQFQSDKYPWCEPGFVPLKITDQTAQRLLWQYAQDRRKIDPEFADDLEQTLKDAGYEGPPGFELTDVDAMGRLTDELLSIKRPMSDHDIERLLDRAHALAAIVQTNLPAENCEGC